MGIFSFLGFGAWLADPYPRIEGTKGADTIYGTADANLLVGLEGNDSLKGFGGTDWLDGGAGIDTAFYGDSSAGVVINLATGADGIGGSAQGDRLFSIENVYGSSYNDTLTGNNEANLLVGGAGLDILKGGGGHDRLLGDAGDDYLKGGGGSDYLEGGTGIDTADYRMAESAVGADLTNNGNAYGEAIGDFYVGVENLTGSAFSDTLLGDAGANAIRGEDGEDLLSGRAGADYIDGGNGSDLLDGGLGADRMAGGAGHDVFWVDNVGDVVLENAGEGSDRITSSVSYTLPANVEQLVLLPPALNGTGNELDNSIEGTLADNVLDGRGGADTMRGYAGNDTYIVDHERDVIFESGGQGSDTVRASRSYLLPAGADIELLTTTNDAGTDQMSLYGNASGQVIRGNAGFNFLGGGDGRDQLIGLGGNDTFVFTGPLNAATNLDVVSDFSVVDDRIGLGTNVFGALNTPTPLSERFVIGTAALDANDALIYNPTSGLLSFDADGNGAGAAIAFAQLSPGLALTSADFVLYLVL